MPIENVITILKFQIIFWILETSHKLLEIGPGEGFGLLVNTVFSEYLKHEQVSKSKLIAQR